VSPIRVVLATLPPLLADIVRETLVREGGVEIVAEIGDTNAIEATIDRTNPHVAVLGVAPADWAGLSGFLRNVLANHPRLAVVALASDGRSGYVYQHQPRGVLINDITPKTLAIAIQSIAAATDVNPAVHPFSAE